MSYGTIVVGTDGSETAGRAVLQASKIAAAEGARVVIVTAYTPSGTSVPGADVVPADIRFTLTDRVQAEELAARGRVIAKEEGVGKVVVQAISGDPANVLLEAAKDFDADLIVVGSRGLTSHAHFILGSVAASVAHHAPCDVLVAHTTGLNFAARGRAEQDWRPRATRSRRDQRAGPARSAPQEPRRPGGGARDGPLRLRRRSASCSRAPRSCRSSCRRARPRSARRGCSGSSR